MWCDGSIRHMWQAWESRHAWTILVNGTRLLESLGNECQEASSRADRGHEHTNFAYIIKESTKWADIERLLTDNIMRRPWTTSYDDLLAQQCPISSLTSISPLVFLSPAFQLQVLRRLRPLTIPPTPHLLTIIRPMAAHQFSYSSLLRLLVLLASLRW
jgi:hypothetical protein